MFILFATMLLVLIVYGTFVSRWHGGGFIPGSPKIIKNFLWAAPMAAVAFYATSNYWVYALALALCMIGKGTGHGGGMDLAHSPKEPGGNPSRSPEKLEHLILWLHGKIPQYWYDALLLVIVGLAAVSGAALAVGSVNLYAGLTIALGGALKAPAYMIGWKLFPSKRGSVEEFDEATEVGEGLTGFFAYTGIALAIVLLMEL